MILSFRHIPAMVVCVVIMTFFCSIQPVCGQNADQMSFLNPLPAGNNINDAWSPDGDNFYFAGDGGIIIFFDGSDFTIMPTPTDHALYGIYGTSANDIWAVGGNHYSEFDEPGRSVILHYDGSGWTAQTPPADSWGQYFVFSDVWCDGNGIVWAVTRSKTEIARMTGGTWQYVDTGISSDYGFHAICGFSATDFYAAGQCGHILHYDNGDWILERQEDGGCEFSSQDILYDVWGPDSDNVFATGNAGQVLKRNPGGTWDTVHSGSIISDRSKYSISGSSASNMYFAGAGGELDYWNGSTYTRLFDSGSDNSQNIIVSHGAGGYYIGMDYGKISGFDGAVRNQLTTDIASGKSWQFAQRAQQIWLCPGQMDTDDKIYAWNGSRLSEIDPGVEMQLRITCFKVFGENDIFLAGYELGGPRYFAKRYNGSAWTNVVSGSNLVDILDVAVSGTDVFAISDRTWDEDMNAFLGYPGIIGGTNYTGEGKIFKAVALADDGKVYAVGKAGAIVSYSDDTWSSENSNTTKDLTCVAAGGGWVCAAGRDRTVVCKNGGNTWQAVSNLSEKEENKFVGIAWSGGETFAAIYNTGNDSEQSYIGSDKGTIYKIEAGTASLLRTGMSSSLGGIGSDSEGKVAIGGSGGIIYGNELPLSDQNRGVYPGIYMLLLD